MRITTILGTSVLSLGLFAGTACKKHDTDKAADQMQKSREDLDDKSKDLSKTTDKARDDIAKDQAKVDEAKADLTKARADFTNAIHARMERIDAKLQDLSTRTDAKAKEAIARARADRDALQSKLDTVNTQTADHWDNFKKDVDDSFDKVEKDLNDAAK